MAANIFVFLVHVCDWICLSTLRQANHDSEQQQQPPFHLKRCAISAVDKGRRLKRNPSRTSSPMVFGQARHSSEGLWNTIGGASAGHLRKSETTLRHCATPFASTVERCSGPRIASGMIVPWSSKRCEVVEKQLSGRAMICGRIGKSFSRQ